MQKQWTLIDRQPTTWTTSKYRWWGVARTWERGEGDLKETVVLRTPERQQIRNRSRYIPAGEKRNV